MKLSVVILAKNEAEVIAKAIQSAKLLVPHEIIVIDDASYDGTVSIAKKNGAKVISHQKKDFSEARNFANFKALGDWILYLDADERISEELALEIKDIAAKSSEHGVYSIPRVNFYLGKKWPKVEQHVRLFKKSSLKGWQGNVHETAVIDGEIGFLKGNMLHYTHRNISEMVDNTNVWSELEAKLRFDAHHPPVVWWRFFRVMLTTFWDYYVAQGGWRVGSVGLIESLYQTFSIFITYAKLWEMQKKI
ncbi:glycosyltransferase family 2 protein [Candidatus Microgenomates bacterium]|nr:MAG: glycosyltransferase family 2 protein [Candidatus Microgenomates bacterium]